MWSAFSDMRVAYSLTVPGNTVSVPPWNMITSVHTASKNDLHAHPRLTGHRTRRPARAATHRSWDTTTSVLMP